MGAGAVQEKQGPVVPAPRRDADGPTTATAPAGVSAYLRLARTIGLGVLQSVAEVRDQAAAPAPPAPRRPERPRDLRSAASALFGEALRPADRPAHPAYPAILEQVVGDEARILVHLLAHGPQPSVDVVTGGPVGRMLPTPLARCLVGFTEAAGLRHGCQLPQYLNNLTRLGLVWHSPEPLPDARAYRDLERRDEVVAALRSARFARVVRRSLALTALGRDFTVACFGDADG